MTINIGIFRLCCGVGMGITNQWLMEYLVTGDRKDGFLKERERKLSAVTALQFRSMFSNLSTNIGVEVIKSVSSALGIICKKGCMTDVPNGWLFVTDDITFLICPGIANSAESVYIRSFVVHSQQCGYRCYVLNHLGVVPSVKLTAARLFTYGKKLTVC